jgi:hypothetical protein
MALFNLSKWYLDCVTDLGDAVIAYTGNLHWGTVRLHYSSILEATGERIVERHSVRRQVQPEAEDSFISWRSKALAVDGVWERVSPAVRETVYSSEQGRIDWNCLIPLARARLCERSGLGYVEHLTMTIAPWKLPIHTLRWGRFTSPSDWMTWIDWQGEFARRTVYINGDTLLCSKIEDDQLEGEDETRLVMDCSLVLRNGPLGTTALSAVPGIGRMFPLRLLRITECKWRSRARLQRKGKPPVEGWAIHETVSWPR